MRAILSILCFFCVILVQAQAEPNWQKGVEIPPGGRNNPYAFPQDQYEQYVLQGKIHAQIYPVEVTGLLPPYEPIKYIVEEPTNPIKEFFRSIFAGLTGIHRINDFLRWVGLHPYPKETDTGVYAVPYPGHNRPDYLMGFGLIHRQQATGFTISCAACHSANLFGKTVLGLSNRFPRANETFIRGKFAASLTSPTLFQIYTFASADETQLLRKLKKNLHSVGVIKPLALGLDTSLAQVALSLARRAPDAYASKSAYYYLFPRKDILDKNPADSKPAVWWNIKYKDRWLSDGSIVSGNPIITNILWNEIGRGADLHELQDWFLQNEQKIAELTSAVFSSEAPRFTDFFTPESIDLEKAKRGEQIFNQRCAHCHGVYEKAWNLPGAHNLPIVEQLKTTLVQYHKKTPVIDVGTDPYRYLGMQSLEEKLNPLALSQYFGITIEAQKGYVPPPLVGVWARWPYFHNNSVPSLCAVLTRHENRPHVYYAREANDPGQDFDRLCNGYPKKKSKIRFDTRYPGQGNQGHDEGIFLKDGKELLTDAEKLALIQFLQTL